MVSQETSSVVLHVFSLSLKCFFFPLVSFRIFLVLVFSSVNVMHWGTAFYAFLLGVLWVSQVCGLVCVIDFGKPSTIPASSVSSVLSLFPLFLIFPSHLCCTFVNVLQFLVLFLFFTHFSHCSSVGGVSVDIHGHLFFPWPYPVY